MIGQWLIKILFLDTSKRLTPELTRRPTIIDTMSMGDNLDERQAKGGRVQ
jgi:hypothetical protein